MLGVSFFRNHIRVCYAQPVGESGVRMTVVFRVGKCGARGGQRVQHGRSRGPSPLGGEASPRGVPACSTRLRGKSMKVGQRAHEWPTGSGKERTSATQRPFSSRQCCGIGSVRPTLSWG